MKTSYVARTLRPRGKKPHAGASVEGDFSAVDAHGMMTNGKPVTRYLRTNGESPGSA